MQSYRQYKQVGLRIEAVARSQKHKKPFLEDGPIKKEDKDNVYPINAVPNRSGEDDVESAVFEDHHSLHTPSRTLTPVPKEDLNQHDGSSEEKQDVFIVGFDGPQDPLNPQNWSNAKRLGAVANVILVGWIMGVALSIDSAIQPEAAKTFGVSEVAESLATGLFLIAFGIGSLAAGPFSEEFGRNAIYIGTMSGFMIFIMASALAPNIGAQLVFRFLAGLFAATPVTCASGSISDMYSPLELVYVFPLFTVACLIGPICGPVLGGFIGQYIDWRWAEWISLIVAGAVLTSIILTQPETYPSILLTWKARHLRRVTGDNRYKAKVELQSKGLLNKIGHALYRPFLIFIREPIIIFWGLYLTVVYIVLFTFLSGYTFVFTNTYGISQGLTGLAFVGIIIGFFLSLLLVPLVWKWYNQELDAAKARDGENAKLPPEVRLWYSMFGGFAIPVSLFWMGWTARPDVSIWSPLAATILYGFGFMTVFLSCYQYLMDCYALFVASALASVTITRYVASGSMVVVAIPMYGNLGVNWTCTLLGCLSAIMVPVPFLLYRYGEKVRSWSKYARGGKGETLG